MDLSENICRLCLLERDESQLIDWNDSVYEGLTYQECYRRSAQLKRYDGDGDNESGSFNTSEEIPYNLICNNCAIQLKEAYQFLMKANIADRMLRSRYFDTLSECDDSELIQMEKNKFPSDRDGTAVLQVLSKEMLSDTLMDASNAELSYEQEMPLNENADPKNDNNEMRQKGESEELSRSSSPKPLKSILKKPRSEPVIESFVGEKKSNGALSRRQSCGRLKQSHCSKKIARDVLNASGDCDLAHIEPQRELLVTSEPHGRELYSKYTYTYHVKVHNKSCDALFRCDKCDRSFFHQLSLNLHRQEHSNSAFKCDRCHKRFKRSIDLDVHRVSHVGEFPHKCDLCSRSFRQKCTLNRHMQRHINVPFYCDICGKEFLSYEKCYQHQLAHGDMLYKCYVCDKEFAAISAIRRHIKSVHKICEDTKMNQFIVNLKSKQNHLRLALD